jgi:hypothetical protein
LHVKIDSNQPSRESTPVVLPPHPLLPSTSLREELEGGGSKKREGSVVEAGEDFKRVKLEEGVLVDDACYQHPVFDSTAASLKVEQDA